MLILHVADYIRLTAFARLKHCFLKESDDSNHDSGIYDVDNTLFVSNSNVFLAFTEHREAQIDISPESLHRNDCVDQSA